MLPQPRGTAGAAAAQGGETQSRSPHALLDTLLVVVREGTVPGCVRSELAVVLACAAALPDTRRTAKPQGEAFH